MLLLAGSKRLLSRVIVAGQLSRSFATSSGVVTRGEPHPDVLYFEDVITEAEEQILLNDCDVRLNAKKYLGSHYDAVIQDYRETEMPFRYWSPQSLVVIKSLFEIAFKESGLPRETPHLSPHVIDLKANTGVIYPHVDSLKHGGAIVASLSLISARPMRLTDPPKDFQVGTKLALSDSARKSEIEYVLKPRTFYILTKAARYDLAHEILRGTERRVSVVFRDQPKDFMPDWAKDFMTTKSSDA